MYTVSIHRNPSDFLCTAQALMHKFHKKILQHLLSCIFASMREILTSFFVPFRPQNRPHNLHLGEWAALWFPATAVDVFAFRARCGFWALVLIQTTDLYRISRRFQPTSFSACVRARKTTRALQLQAAFTPVSHNTAVLYVLLQHVS